MSQQPQSILILGAGELGSTMLAHLSEEPELSATQFTMVLRPLRFTDSDRAHLNWIRSSVEDPSRLSLASLDLDAEDAKTALKQIILTANADIVIGCTGFGTGRNSGLQVLITNAVLESGIVKRYFAWQFGDYDVIGPDFAGGLVAEQCAVRALLREKADAAGVEWTIVTTGLFMSFVFEEWFGLVQGLGKVLGEMSLAPLYRGRGSEVVVRALGGWETELTLTDVHDVGRVLAILIVEPLEVRNGSLEKSKDSGGSVVFTAGQTVTYRDLAVVVQAVVGSAIRVSREEWTLDYLNTELEKDPEDQVKKLRVLCASGKGVSWDKAKTFNAERGILTRGVVQWLWLKLTGRWD